MLTRRQLLIAAAVSPIAQFCRTEPGLSLAGSGILFVKVQDIEKYVQFLDEPITNQQWIPKRHGTPTCTIERRYALPPGTLG